MFKEVDSVGELGVFLRDTWAEIDLDSIFANITGLKELIDNNVTIIAVVKANAYGHGDVQIAKTALEAGATYIAVATLDEAMALRKKGISAPILVLGASRPQDINTAAKSKITLTVFNEKWLLQAKDVLENGLTINLHIKIDTGMGRLGVKTALELKTIEQLITNEPSFILEGVFTHFATADELNQTYLNEQLQLFNDLIQGLNEKPKLIHASNSAASLRKFEAHFNAVRMGIAMYGCTPSLEIEPHLPYRLKEALSLHTRIAHVKKLKKGEKVSYGATYEASEDEWIGTLPIGYADGWLRKLQGIEVLVDGLKVPIVGRICMDQCMIKLPYELPIGTTVTLVGEQNDQKVSINDVAKKLDTINYEVLCMISSRVPRVYKKSGKVVEVKNAILHY